MKRFAASMSVFVVALGLYAPRAAQAQAAPLDCRTAIGIAEREYGIPPRLLTAIARVESGRRNAETGRVDPYPWTINAEGRGSVYPSKSAVIAAVQDLQAGGMRSIDVGCMQVNLRHHGKNFASLEEAFDPLTNARYAARFLSELMGAKQNWNQATAGYHSQNPEFGEPYLAKVLAAWEVEKGLPNTPQAPIMQVAAVTPAPVQPQPRGPAAPPPSLGAVGGGFFLSNGAEKARIIPAQPAPGGTPGIDAGAGRGLGAYRSEPVPIAGRAMQPVPKVTMVSENGAVTGRRLF